MNTRRLLTLAFSLLLTAFFLALALYRVEWEKLAHAFVTADYRLVALAALCWLSGYGLRTLRWQKFLLPTQTISLARLFPVLIIGFAFNNLLPGRPGELARAYLVGVRENLAKTTALATVVAERVADGIMVVVFLALAFGAFVALHLTLPAGTQTMIVFAMILFGSALGALLLLLARADWAQTILGAFTRFLPHALAARVSGMLDAFIIGLRAFGTWGNTVTIGALSLGVWALDSLAYFTMLSAFGALPDLSLRFAAAPLLTGIINLGIMIPAAPGGLGPYEAAGVFALSTLNVDATLAASVALAAHAVQYVMITGLGIVLAWRMGVALATPR